jgi:hypothetical protein
MRAIVKLLVGETRVLPLGIAAAVGAVAIVRVAAGPGWAIGVALAASLAVVLAVSVRRRPG